ncbi:DUF6884 domain-containing protein [Mycobacterium sp. 23]|uniref:DUF6884 domain-containing protein n=1 Tax=Mycobacterium sp. 23 TaxID=3400424 RepID=UPI003AAB9156
MFRTRGIGRLRSLGNCSNRCRLRCIKRPRWWWREQRAHQRVHVVLVTYAKSKGNGPAPAKDLYISPLFRKKRAYAERDRVP